VADAFLVTCEHGGNRIPPAYRRYFRGQRALLDSHRGYDPGALKMAAALADALGALLLTSTVSRLLVDLNRSLDNPRVFSPGTRRMPAAMRAQVVEQHYRPYRDRAERFVARSVAKGRRVIHVSAHSFTPVLHGRVRHADVGLLYDPARRGEVELCARWKQALASSAPEWRVHRNYPYAGKGDGLASYLRRRHPAGRYVGIELEINQAIVFAGGPRWRALQREVVRSLLLACGP
jgi:predicted N-formylglutamate amidohydrolase